MTLTDDPYGTPEEGEQEQWVPAWAVGRLVERPREMTAQIEAFLAADGEVQLDRALVAGYDFMQDAAEEVAEELKAAGVPDTGITRLLGRDWTADVLRQLLQGRGYDLAFFAVHAEHYAHDTPQGGEIRADEIAGGTGEVAGSVAYAAACHAGLSVPDTEGHEEASDFPQAWASRGAAFVGPTGDAYGRDEVLYYQEALMSGFTQELAARDGTAIGDALVWAKRDYFVSHDQSAMHEKTLAGTVLYGLPMLRVRVLGEKVADLSYGAVVGIVDLVDIVPLSESDYEQAKPEHLSDAEYLGEPCYGWHFAQPSRLPQPVPLRGKMALFNVPDEIAVSAGRDPAKGVAVNVADPARPFVLFTLPDEVGAYRAALYQWPFRDDDVEREGRRRVTDPRAPGALWRIELRGDQLRAVAERVLSALRANGYKPTALARTPKEPFYLDETTGLRLALTFLAVKPLTRFDRIERIEAGVRHMSDEEAYYWFSKCTGGSQAIWAQKALRTLLAGE